MNQESGMDGLLKHIELCGRTAYKSEDLITPDSAPKFTDMLIKRGHGAVLEHGTVYLNVPFKQNDPSNGIGYDVWYRYKNNMYSTANQIQTKFEPKNSEGYVAVTTNYRVLLENDWLDDLQYLSDPTEEHKRKVTIKFTCDRGVSHEFVRHRVFSFVQESTRYCNYSKDKFGQECTFILPCWLNDSNLDSWDWKKLNTTQEVENFPYLQLLKSSEDKYLSLLEYNKWTPQQARSVLPNSLKTELIMTGTVDQWKGFFKLRCAPDAHPQARELAVPLEEKFKELGYVG